MLIALTGGARSGKSRAATAMASMPAASGSGLGHGYAAHLRAAPCAPSVLASYGAAFALGQVGVFAVGAATGTALVVGLAAYRRFGGSTGDVLGAISHLSQIAALVAVSRLLDDFGWFWN